MSISAIVICVVAVTLLHTAVGHTSLVFLQLAEQQVGESDLVVLPTDGAFLNATAMSANLLPGGGVAGVAPRWLLAAQVAASSSAAAASMTVAAVVARGVSARVVVYDSLLEERLQVSRQWRHPALQMGECHASTSLLTLLGGAPGATLSVLPDLDLPVSMMYGSMGGPRAMQERLCQLVEPKMCSCFSEHIPWVKSNFTAKLVEAMPILEQCTGYPLSILVEMFVYRCRVVSSVSTPVGKWSSNLGNVLALDSTAIEKHIADKMNPLLALMAPGVPQWDTTTTRSPLWGHAMSSMAMSVNIYMSSRLEAYSGTEEAIKARVRLFADMVATRLGLAFKGKITAPVYSSLEGYLYGRLLFKNLSMLLVGFLVFLASILLLSILTASVEEKSYEFGLLRSMGLDQTSLAAMLTIRAVTIAVPGLGIGLLVSSLAYIPVAYQISSFTGAPLDPSLNGEAVGGAIVFAIALPILANIPATSRAMGQTLRNALDVFHNSAQEVSISRIRLDELGISPSQAVCGGLMAGIGGVVYYGVPYAFVTGQFEVFLLLMSLILLALIFGLVMLSLPLLPVMERAILYCMLWGRDRVLVHIIHKNLEAHRTRSRRSSVVLTLCVAYIIYGTSGLQMQADSLAESIRSFVGSDIVIMRTPFIGDFLPHLKLRAWIDMEKNRGVSSPVRSAAFITARLSDQIGMSSGHRETLFNFAGVPAKGFKVHVVGVESNLLDASYSRFALVAARDSGLGTGDDVVRSLYQDSALVKRAHGMGEEWVVPAPLLSSLSSLSSSRYSGAYNDSIPLLLSQGFGLALSVGIDTSPLLVLECGSHYTLRLGLVRAMLRKMPGSMVSSYKLLSMSGLTPAMVSLPSFIKLMASVAGTRPGEEGGSSLAMIRYDKLYVKLRTTNPDHRRYVMDGLRSNLDPGNSQLLIDANEAVESLDNVVAIITALAEAVSGVAFLLVFFLSWASFDAQVRENAWELGVVRALGLTKRQVIRVYIYEALCLVLAATVVGSAIGIVTSVTLTLQYDVMVEMPFSFTFPWLQLTKVALGCSLIAAGASYFPANKLAGKPIAGVLKGANL